MELEFARAVVMLAGMVFLVGMFMCLVLAIRHRRLVRIADREFERVSRELGAIPAPEDEDSGIFIGGGPRVGRRRIPIRRFFVELTDRDRAFLTANRIRW